MCTLYMIMNVPNRKIDRPVVVLACRNWYSHFVTAEDDRDKCCTISLWVFRNFILKEQLSMAAFDKTCYYARAILREFTVWDIVKFPIEVSIWKEILDNNSRVPVPDIVCLIHPQRNIFWWFVTAVLQPEALPGCVAYWGHVDGFIEVCMVCKRWNVLMGCEGWSP